MVAGGLYRLLKADGDEQTDVNGGNVDEEVSPGMGGGMGWMDVKHWCDSVTYLDSGMAACAVWMRSRVSWWAAAKPLGSRAKASGRMASIFA